MSSIRVSVDGVEHEVDLSAVNMTLREHVTLQRQVGNQTYDLFIRTGSALIRGDFLEGYLYAKLKTRFPDLEPEAIDVDFVALVEAIKALVVDDPNEDDEGKE